MSGVRTILCVLGIIVLCITLPVPVAADISSTTSGAGTSPDIATGSDVTRTYTYYLDGRSGSIPLTLPNELYQDYLTKNIKWDIRDNASYFLAFTNDPAQEPYITLLASGIREETSDPDSQARIATNLVQHLTYQKGVKYRFPYEVLYEENGVCGEKSMLLSALLKKLGFQSAVLYFVPENHMTAAIGCPAPYDYRNTGYCLIEATRPRIITDDASTFPSFGHLWSEPEVIPVSNGRTLGTADADYYDARSWIAINARNAEAKDTGGSLSTADRERWYELNAKYDIVSA
jgi:hypothetical protein